VAGVEPEVEGGADAVGQWGQQGCGYLDHGAAALADQMQVAVVGELVDGPAVPEMHVRDNAQPFECVEGAVDRRQVHIRVARLHVRGQILRGYVTVGIDNGQDEGPPGYGDPPPG
jgi:hypothetical protein